ncbi:hypothetical protein D3C75_789880 [compost metagenome]
MSFRVFIQQANDFTGKNLVEVRTSYKRPVGRIMNTGVQIDGSIVQNIKDTDIRKLRKSHHGLLGCRIGSISHNRKVGGNLFGFFSHFGSIKICEHFVYGKAQE